MSGMPGPGGLYLARYAEASFWLARYMERAENLARLMEVVATITRDRDGVQGWRMVLRTHADEARFRRTGLRGSADAIRTFYVLVAGNPTSLVAAIGQARENAQTLRPVLPIELWTQINQLHGRIREVRSEDLAGGGLARLCADVRQACQTHAGIADGTLFRDQGWQFYQLGKVVERADQATRLVDMGPASPTEAGPDSEATAAQALLTAASAFHAYRRIYPRDMSAQGVADFMLYDPRFPRALLRCIRRLAELTSELGTRFQLPKVVELRLHLDELESAMLERRGDIASKEGLHRLLDWVQRRLVVVTDALAEAYFRR